MKESESQEFDEYAGRYQELLNKGLAISGEQKEYFAERRIDFLSRCLAKLKFKPEKIMDFGTGVGTALPLLRTSWPNANLIAYDVSAEILAIARRDNGDEKVKYFSSKNYCPSRDIDLVYCNGVFHHIAKESRLETMELLYNSVSAQGKVAIWENTPWNPVTRYIMWKIPFDKEAKVVAPWTLRKLGSAVGFKRLRIDFFFIFPKKLQALRFLEEPLSKVPLGCQYQVLLEK